MNTNNDPNANHLELGAIIGKSQAFAVLANMTAGAQAACFRDIRDSETYKLTGLSWNDFCPRYTGFTRPRVDEIIHNLEEFGQTFFRLSEIARLSPQTYRHLAPSIYDDSIDIDGALVRIVPENTHIIRRAVQQLRERLQQAAETPPPQIAVAGIRARLDAAFHQIERLSPRLAAGEERRELEDLLNYSINRLVQLLGAPSQ